MYLDEPDTPQARPEPDTQPGCDRRGFLTAALVGGALSLPLAGVAAPASAAAVQGRVYTVGKRNTKLDTKYPRAEFRGMWVASVLNVDWPSKPGLPVATQKAELRALLDLAVKRRLNTVLLQVRPTADRMWASTLGEPWSKYLTGTQGKDPGYDPLAYAVAEAHKRALGLHAWINPYRVSMGTSLNSLVATHPARKNPSWTFAYGGKRYYNPGIPAVRNYIISVIKDLVKRYDVDGIHFDDYFYPYPVSGTNIPDAATYKAYKGSFTSVADWRRNNVNVFVRDVHKAIHATKPRVVFGISPFGIWRNQLVQLPGLGNLGVRGLHVAVCGFAGLGEEQLGRLHAAPALLEPGIHDRGLQRPGGLVGQAGCGDPGEAHDRGSQLQGRRRRGLERQERTERPPDQDPVGAGGARPGLLQRHFGAREFPERHGHPCRSPLHPPGLAVGRCRTCRQRARRPRRSPLRSARHPA